MMSGARKKTTFSGLFGVLVTLFLVYQCVGESPKKTDSCKKVEHKEDYITCKTNSECPSTMTVCQPINTGPTGLCTNSCKVDNDCGQGTYCVEHKKFDLPLSCFPQCSINECCPTGLTCSAHPLDEEKGMCVPEAWLTDEPLCQEEETKCKSLSLETCTNNQWESQHCDAICANQGEGKATKCARDATQGKDICYCKPIDPITCAENEVKCEGLNLLTCQGGSWSSQTCDSICIAQGESGATGCSNAACVCGTTQVCTENEAKCNGTNLETCRNNAWQSESCTSICQASGFDKATGCTNNACVCENNPPPVKKFGEACQVGASQCDTGLQCVRFTPSTTNGFCSKSCTNQGGACPGAPSGMYAACILPAESGTGLYCAFLCKISTYVYNCPTDLTCSGQPADAQRDCRP